LGFVGGRYEHVFPFWNQQGVAVFVYDQRGYGRTCSDVEKKAPNASYGKTNGRQQVEDIEFFVDLIARRFEDIPLFLMGFSMAR
jgi:acylglycerol lipase